MTTYYARLKGTAFCNPSRTEVGSDNTNVTGWPVTQAFIYCVAIGRDTRDPPAETFKLQWRVSGGTFADLGATGAMKYTTSTVLSNGTALTSGNAKVAVSNMTWQNGEEVEDGVSGSIDLGSDYYTEIQFGVDPADATVGSTYEFQVVGSVNGVLATETGSMLTVGVVSGTYSISAPYDSTAVADVPTVSVSEAIPVNISDPYDSTDVDDVVSNVYVDLNIDTFDAAAVDAVSYSPVEVEEAVVQTIVEDVEIFFVFTVDKGDDIAVNEFCEAVASACVLDTYDDIVILENTTVIVSDLVVNVEDSTTVEDNPTVTNTEISTSVYSEASVSEDVQGAVSDLAPDTYDEIIVSEFSEAAVDSPEVSIFDTILVSEDSIIEVGSAEPVDVSTEDSISVLEDVLTLVSDPQVDAYSETTVSDVVISVEVSEPAAGPTLGINVFSEVTISEEVVVSVPNLGAETSDSISIVESLEIRQDDLQAIGYDTCSVTDTTAPEVSAPSINVTDSVVLSEYLITEVSSPVANVVDSISISEEVSLENTDNFLDTYDNIGVYDLPSVEVEGLLPDLTLNVFSSCSVSEYLILEESDEEVSVSDLVTISDYVESYIGIESQAVDPVSISEDVLVAVEVAADITVTVIDSVSTAENYSVVRDHVIDVNDSVVVTDLPLFDSALAISVDDLISIDSSVVYTEFHISASISDIVGCTEAVTGTVSDLSISVYDNSTVSEYSSIYWFLAEGILVIDSDVIIPTCTIDLMVPEIGIYAMLPTNELEMEQ